MAKEPIPTAFFVLVVVRLGHRFLIVRETKHGQPWYMPAGRVEPGETLVDAACRETLEESGIPIVVEGIVRVEHTPQPGGSARLRVVFVARPRDDTAPKDFADTQSLGAAWVTLEEIADYPLRGDEVRAVFEHVAGGGAIYPLSVLTLEGQAYRR